MRLRRELTISLAVLALSLLSALGVRLAASSDEPDENSGGGNASVLVQQTALRQGSLPQTIRAYGTAQADAAARDSLMAPTAARIAAVYVRLGQQVAAGAPLVQLVPTPSTATTYAQAVSALKVASEASARTQQLLGEHLATRQQLADAQKAEADARAALAALRTQGAGGARTLRAPFAAIVTALPISTNALVTEGSALLELARPGKLILLAGVAPAQAASVRPGAAARVTAIGGSRSFDGQVLMRGSIVDATSGLVPVQISLPAGGLFPGQTAEAEITVGSVRGYVVPHPAILIDDHGDTYVVQTEKGVAKTVHVRVLGTHDGENVIDGPLDPAAPVVLAGNYQLKDGMRVRLSNAATEPARPPGPP